MKNDIIITVGLGFIGSNLIDYLIKKKFNIISLDKDSRISITLKNLKKIIKS